MRVGLAILLVLAAGAKSAPPSEGQVTASIIELIAHPKKFEGRNVQTVGFALTYKSRVAVYIGEDQAMHGVPRTCILLETEREAGAFDRKWVITSGRYHAIPPEESFECAGEIKVILGLAQFPPESAEKKDEQSD